MIRRQRTLTAIGLPVHKELLVKALLHVVNVQTTDQWQFSEESVAHVAICDPESALPALVMRRSQQDGSPRCIFLVADRNRAPSGPPTLRDPIRAADLITFLNDVSAALDAYDHGSVAAGPPTIHPRKPAPAIGFLVAETLCELIRSRSEDIFRVETAGTMLHVQPAERVFYVAQPITETMLVRMLEEVAHPRVTRLTGIAAQALRDHGGARHSIDPLLWYVGLRSPRDRLLTLLPEDGRFGLRRWPDFGLMKHDQVHLRLTALLARAPHSVKALTSTSGCPLPEVLAFVNACAVSDLLEIHPAEKTEAAAHAAPRTRYGGLFRSLRAVLGLGTP